MGSTDRVQPVEIDSPAALRIRIFELIQDIQSGDPQALEETARIRVAAEKSGFDRVVRAALFGQAVAAWMEQDGGLAKALDVLIGRSRLDGDGAMTALGLGMRAAFLAGPDGELASPEYEGDLAEAVVLLQSDEGPALERISAHTSCGIAFDYRSLWELADEQYGAALSLGEQAESGVGEVLLAAVMFNRAEAHVSWAGRLHQVGDDEAVEARWKTWQAVAEIPEGLELPTLWRNELSALGELMRALARFDVRPEVDERLRELDLSDRDEPRARGHLLLARALSTYDSGSTEAAARADEALTATDPEIFPQMYDLALFLAAQAEAEGGRSAGLRCAEQHLRHRWADRLARLGAMTSRIERAHLQQRVESLSQVANLDELTGIANRRALAAFTHDLESRFPEMVAVVMVDVDDFKLVNDGHGHSVGDEVLIRIASLLHQSVRPVDIAARLGGDEFLVIMANASEPVALQRAEAILTGIANQVWEELSPGLTVSVSIGVAAGKSSDLDTLRANADRAAYNAKRRPGNWITCHPSEPGTRPGATEGLVF